jgi:hypothetical protein
MKSMAKSLGSAAVAGALLLAATAAQAQSAVNDWGPATAPITPRLAPGVAKADAYHAPSQKYVAAFDQPIYAEMNVYGRATDQTVKRGQRLDVIAYASRGNWLLVGRNGEGVGYVPRSLATPEKYAHQIPR